MAGDEHDDVVEAEVLPAVRQVELNLFGGGDAEQVVARATEVANALASVIEQKNLYKQIGRSKHVFVEGWTLLGSMLGVFPVVEWTRQLDDGWEARVSAQTLGGQVVGSAEAMCTRKESKWKTSDEYAIRSMAQTRATSKALRLPLGFVMTLGGYHATPAEEIDIREDAAPVQPDVTSPDFDPGVHLMEGAARGPNALSDLAEQMKAIDPMIDWRDLVGQIEGERNDVFWRRLANAVANVTPTGDFPPVETSAIVESFAWAFEGQTVAPIPAVPEEPAPISADTPVEPDDTIPFTGGAYGEDRP